MLSFMASANPINITSGLRNAGIPLPLTEFDLDIRDMDDGQDFIPEDEEEIEGDNISVADFVARMHRRAEEQIVAE